MELDGGGKMNTYRIKVRTQAKYTDPRTSFSDHIDMLVRSHSTPKISFIQHLPKYFFIAINVKSEKRAPASEGHDVIKLKVFSHSAPNISVHRVKNAKFDLEPEDLIKESY